MRAIEPSPRTPGRSRIGWAILTAMIVDEPWLAVAVTGTGLGSRGSEVGSRRADGGRRTVEG